MHIQNTLHTRNMQMSGKCALLYKFCHCRNYTNTEIIEMDFDNDINEDYYLDDDDLYRLV